MPLPSLDTGISTFLTNQRTAGHNADLLSILVEHKHLLAYCDLLPRQRPHLQRRNHAIEYLQHYAAAIPEAIAEFYATQDLERQAEIAHAISEQVLAPVGGMWRKDEILASGVAG